MNTSKDPGFHRCEVEFRPNESPGNPNLPDMLVIDHVTGSVIRLPADESLRSIAKAIVSFMDELAEKEKK